LFAQTQLLDEGEVRAAEHEREMQRRDKARLELLEQKRLEQEERIQRAIVRARDPPFKRVGKPVMFRSQPPQRKQREVTEVKKETERDILVRDLFTA